MSAIGYGKISARKVVDHDFSREQADDPPKPDPAAGLSNILSKKPPSRARTANVVKVKGIEDLLVRFARCCNPLPGDSVVGFITRGRGISVHSRKCPKMFDSDPHRLVEIEWDLSKKAERKVKIRVVCEDRPGLFADMSQAIRDQNANITGPNRHDQG